jgi:hypothetical protein
MRHIVLALAIVCIAAVGRAQPAASVEREAVLAAVQKFFDTMAAGDIAGGRAITLPEGRFYSLREGKPGEAPAVNSFTNQESYDRMASGKRKLHERMWNPTVLVHGSIAVVWTPYDFWIDGKFSHCGVDAFMLAKLADGWKIVSLADTRRREGCPTR